MPRHTIERMNRDSTPGATLDPSRVFAPIGPEQAGLPGSGRAARAFRRLERGLDRICGESDNPLRQLGAMGFHLFWIVVASGIYLYIYYDTSVAQAWESVQRLTTDQPWAGGLMRSLHRYASDALVVVLVLHALREWVYGRFRDFRAFSWVSGVPTIWLLLASGVIGYWLVWDEVAQFVAVALTEWFGALPGFGVSLIRNFITDAAMTDRLFSLMVFLHIGVPLALLGTMWVHIQRLTRPRTLPSRALGAWVLAVLLALSAAIPALSEPLANLAQVPRSIPIDWFYLGVFPAVYATSPLLVWAVALGATALLIAAPWIARRPRPAPALVDPDNCNGCSRCFADCPYEAIAMVAHPKGRGLIAVVNDNACASCGICAGACPSSTPFRRGEALVTGIDLPTAPVTLLRDRLEASLRQWRANDGTADGPLVVFSCQHGAGLRGADPRVMGFGLPCAAHLPPPFIDYALRSGARGVLVASCPPQDCEFRFGADWSAQRLAGAREPHLRTQDSPPRWRTVAAAREDESALQRAIDDFLLELDSPPVAASSPRRRGAVSPGPHHA